MEALKNLDMEILKVGGCVRDAMLGVRTKDIDFVVVIDPETFPTIEQAFEHMVTELESASFKIFVSNPEFATLRAQFPPELQTAFGGVRDADFVLSRIDGPSFDGRRPEFVSPGTLRDDLARRDFTVNAMAETFDGTIIDLFGGVNDLETMTLRFVGDPAERIAEDALRVIRALRFCVTKGFTMAPETREAIMAPSVPVLVSAISDERLEIELSKMLAADTIGTLELLSELPKDLQSAIFAGRVRLTATLKA